MKPYYSESGIDLYCGDCREVLPSLLPKPKVDLLLTDPQYQLANGKKATTMGRSAKRGGSGNLLGGTLVTNVDHGLMVGDDEPFDPAMFLGFPKVILWGAIHYANRLPNSTRWLVWDKRDGIDSDDNADCEMAWTNLRGPARLHRQLWKGICRAGEENIAISGGKLHTFQKPIALMRWCIGIAGDAQTILDPFMGSGTTIRAAKDLGRKAIGIEINEAYCEIAANRLRQEVLQFA